MRRHTSNESCLSKTVSNFMVIKNILNTFTICFYIYCKDGF